MTTYIKTERQYLGPVEWKVPLKGISYPTWMKLIATLDRIPSERFNMNDVLYHLHGSPFRDMDMSDNPEECLNDCKTAGCIAGWTNMLFKMPTTEMGHLWGMSRAAVTLGINSYDGERLFLGKWFTSGYRPARYMRVYPGGEKNNYEFEDHDERSNHVYDSMISCRDPKLAVKELRVLCGLDDL